jgi:hypothetical protein
VKAVLVDDIATVNNKFALYPTAPPASMIVLPRIERLISGHIAYSVSM